MFSSKIPLDQTAFSGEQPMYQETELSAAQLEKLAEKPPKKPLFKQKKFLFGLPLLILLLIILMLIFLRKPEIEVEPEIPDIQKQEQSSSYMVERIRRLQAELKKADPTKTDIVFPPVDMTLELDKAE